MSSTIGDPYKPNLDPLWWYDLHTTDVGSARSLPNDPASCFADHTQSSDDNVQPRCYDSVQVRLPSTSRRTSLFDLLGRRCNTTYKQKWNYLPNMGSALGPASEPQVPQDRRPVHEELQIIRMLDPPSERYYCGSSQCRYGASLSTPMRRAQQYCVLCYLTHRLTTMMRLWLRSGPGAE
jgi:hypothetical protein